MAKKKSYRNSTRSRKKGQDSSSDSKLHLTLENTKEYRANKHVFDPVFRLFAKYLHDKERMYQFTLGEFGNIMPNARKARAMYDKNLQYYNEGKITKEVFDKYQTVVKNALAYVNISLDSGSDT